MNIEGIKLSELELNRFMNKVHVEPNSGCWLWSGTCKRGGSRGSGYATITVRGITKKASRVSYAHFKEFFPKELFILHSCHTKECVNPDHLRTGTHTDNMLDRKISGRTAKAERSGLNVHPEKRLFGDANPSRKNPEKLARGTRNGSYTHPEKRRREENHGMAKLNREQVLEIRSSSDTYEKIATLYKVSKSLISAIKNRRLWKGI